ncbi:histidine kinase [Dyadobacter sp. CY323]|uniref:sensor histidine kinase n=1 Tax=Dyadobacter sp. CY323 TaxID=2907302 RepID=UPI001F406880|nr:histidine kinase [Dyadobacter sp. CY323]MCE6987620.1 histidine kinase [Dyadobacter sp. CY323]
MRSKALLCFLLFLCAVFPASGQFIFQNFNQEDGLSANHVRSLYKDPEGFLWVGTINGLDRFDGHLIQRYQSSNGERNLYVNAITPIDDDQVLLIGTPYGIRTFNKRKATYYSDKRFTELAKKVILAIHSDNQDRLWIVSYFDIYIYDHGKIFRLNEVIKGAEKLKENNFTNSAFSAFCWDSKRQGFWVGGSNAFFIDCKNTTIYNREYNPRRYPLLEHKNITAITIDKQFNLWYGDDSSLYFWDWRTNKTTGFNTLDSDDSADSCNNLFIDSKNRLWISTFLHSAYLKEPNGPIKKIPYDQDEPNSIGYSHFRAAMEDREGNVWLGTLNGVSKNRNKEPVSAIYHLPSFPFFHKVKFAQNNSIVISDSIIMTAKEDGIVAYNMNDRSSVRYAATYNKDEYIKNRFYKSVKGRDRWWFAGEDGIYFLKMGAAKIERLNQVTFKTKNTRANFILEDGTGKIWFHIDDDALYRYDPSSDRADRFDSTNPDWNYPKHRNCTSALKLRDGNLLFAYYGSGFIEYNLKNDTFKVIPIRDYRTYMATRMAEDADGNIWSCAWGRGLIKLNRNGVFLDSLNTTDGLLSDYILGLGIDVRGTIWAASNEGLMYVNGETRSVTEVHVHLGKNFQNYWIDVNINKGLVYATMMDQVVVLNPVNFASIPVQKPPHITSIRVFGEDSKQTTDLTDLTGTTELVLNPDQDFLTFRFASLNHHDIPGLRYSYKLLGIDPEWVVSGRATTVSYNNLTPGFYTFLVRSTDQNGNWMKSATTLKIRILPNWWQTWWFIGILAILFGFTGHLIHWSYIKYKEKQDFDKAIDYFANSVYGENSASEICWDITRNCISQLHFEDCSVYMWDESKKKLVLRATYGTREGVEYDFFDAIELELGERVAGTVAFTKTAILIPDGSKEKRHKLRDENIMSELCVPIFHEGEVIGVIDSEHGSKKFFTQQHVRTLSTIASISANKIAEAKAQEDAQEKEILLLEINKMLAESQLMALRAQMNPHFVFNCLNSIQECIVTEKYMEASRYLNKFSKLFRTVLNNSDKNLVTIEEEIDVLELYLELEQMRFEHFRYIIEVDEDLDIEEISLPSMLLQPYVENALWHGLMHKKDDRELLITFKRVSDDIFQCTVEDNGIGRKKSYEIKDKNSKAKRHKSKGLQIARDRLALLKRQDQHAEVNIIDKYNPEGLPGGTLVVIELSTLLNDEL